MPARSNPSFAFLVVTYNHQEYILEHLESIKYLVCTHAAGIDVDLIVNDDCSKDQTRSLVDAWLDLNAHLFRHHKKIYNPQNLGTCASVNNILDYMVADRCKLTAGDDVYSFENIFELTQHENDVAMVSGRPLYLLGDDLRLDQKVNLLVTSTQIIYQKKSLLYRLKHLSYCNAANLLYAKECLMNTKVRSYLAKFDVTEDWPLQIAISRQFPNRRFELVNKVFVYYRRTEGSTFIVANKRFNSDKIKIYEDLIAEENCWSERLRLKSRKICFLLNNNKLNKIINIDFYIFLFDFLVRIKKIYILNVAEKINIDSHRKHYSLIKINARECQLTCENNLQNNNKFK
jgi:glycosyltransferase involved in cell wall biosynthesis